MNNLFSGFCVLFCIIGIPSNTVNYVDNYDNNRFKGKKRVKSSELYQQQSKASSGSEGEEPENPGKRKGLFLTKFLEIFFSFVLFLFFFLFFLVHNYLQI